MAAKIPSLPLPPNDGQFVYCRYFRHWRTGKLVYPKTARFFRFRRNGR